MQYWLVKSEPEVYPLAQLKKDKTTVWDGIRNYTARNNLRLMEVGDSVLFYHSVTGKAVVGLAKVTKTAFQDPKDATGAWSAVEIGYVGDFARPVTLEEMKTVPELRDIKLLKQGRLSVVPLTAQEFVTIEALGNK